MNTARWIMAHQMILEGERRTVRMMARILGTDIDATSDHPKEVKFGDLPAVMPLAALLNPETFKNFVEQDYGNSSIEDSGTKDDVYEAQVKALESAGMLTDIDFLTEEAEQKVKDKNRERSAVKEISDEEWDKVK